LLEPGVKTMTGQETTTTSPRQQVFNWLAVLMILALGFVY
jgi:hypothetical protein